MSFLSEIKNYISKDMLNILPADANKTVDKSADINTPVIECENVGANEDSIEIKNQPQKEQEQAQAAPKNLGQMGETISLKCKANDIGIKSMSKLFAQVAGINKEKYEALPESEKIKVLEAVDLTVNKIIEYKKQYGLSNQADIEEIISMMAQNSLEAVKTGSAKTVREFENEVGDINKELGVDFKNADSKSKRAKLEKIAQFHRNRFEKKLQKELNSIPEDERAAYEAKRREEFRRHERARFFYILVSHDTETANNSIILLAARDMAFAMKSVIKSRRSRAEKTRAADMQTIDYLKNNLKTYYERGEKIEASVIKEANEATMSEKSYQAACKYQKDYKDERTRFANGEDVPPYMSEEVFTATAQGIGSGALNNVNMTTEEKAGFLATWENDAKSFSDYEVVTKGVKEEIAKKPEFEEKFEKAKQNVLKNNETSNETKNEEVYKADANTNSTATIPQTTSDSSTVKSEDLKSDPLKKQIKQEETASRVYQPQNATQQEIVTTVKRPSSLDEAFKQYAKKDIIKVVLGTQHLRHLRPQIADRLNNMDVAELEYYADSTENFLFILRNISPQKAAKLYDKKKAIGHDAKVLGEQILEKGNNEQNAIA